MAPLENPAPELADRLNGWKEIAGHLGKSVSSVQRWERDLALPVRRIKTADGQIVSASRKEVDAWRERLEAPGQALHTSGASMPAPQLLPAVSPQSNKPVVFWAAAAFGILGVALLAAWALGVYPFRLPLKPIASMVLVGSNLEARDDTGAVLWSYSFGAEVSRSAGARHRVGPRDDRFAEIDLDADGSLEHVVPVRFGIPQHEQVAATDALFAFTSAGRLLWRVAPDSSFECAGQRITGPWLFKSVQLSTNPGRKRIWMAYVHPSLGLSFVTEVMADGGSQLRYVQSGWIMSLAEWTTPAGVRLVAGGVMHDADRPSVVMLDPDGPPAMSVDASHRYQCIGAPGGRPLQVVLLPNFDLAGAISHPYLMVERLKVVGSELRAEVGSDVEASIGADGVVKSLTFTDIYWAQHRKLEAAGKLSHSALSCPESTKPQEIRAWTAQGGWQSYVIPPDRLLNPAR